MRKLIIVAAVSALVAAGAVAVAASASQASPAPPAAPQNQSSGTQNKLSISGSVVAGVTSVQIDQYLTFDFTVKNHGRTAVPGDVIYSFSGAKYVDIICPMVGTGGDINPDSPACEPGNLSQGQTTQSAIILHVPVSSRAAAVVVTGCATEENDQVAPQCATLSVPINR